jgi:hypothetical protein
MIIGYSTNPSDPRGPTIHIDGLDMPIPHWIAYVETRLAALNVPFDTDLALSLVRNSEEITPPA